MHETSLNQVITDYVTGEDIQATTYEDLRQSIARLLIQDKGYPREAVQTKVPLVFEVQGTKVEYSIDFLIYAGQNPALLVAFCPGAVASYLRQYVAAARIVSDPPPALVFVTDTKEGVLMRVSDGKRLGDGFQALPDHSSLQEMVDNHPAPKVDPKTRQKARNLVHAFFSLSGECSSYTCS
ncbi:MAG: type I restriction enzyme HsdR N-terminal domain-containing protein [Desulfonatronovibrionaceae bacterium]